MEVEDVTVASPRVVIERRSQGNILKWEVQGTRSLPRKEVKDRGSSGRGIGAESRDQELDLDAEKRAEEKAELEMEEEMEEKAVHEVEEEA